MQKRYRYFISLSVLCGLVLASVLGSGTGTGTNVVDISAGGYHSLALGSNGTLWAWGWNNTGQLGDGTTANRLVPISVLNLTNGVFISSGYAYSLTLNGAGTNWAWGQNGFGQLGDGTTNNSSLPVLTVGLPPIIAIAAGGDHSLALTINSNVWAWGRNASGQLGDGTVSNRITPVAVLGVSNIVTIASGYSHSLALDSNGTVWAWGANSLGELGDGTVSNRILPVTVLGLSNVLTIAAGSDHSLAVASDSNVWAWGGNYAGQLGDGTLTNRNAPVAVAGLSNIIAIAGGGGHSLALQDNGQIWAWGDNTEGQLGQGTLGGSSLVPVTVVGLTNGIAISAGYSHSLALTADGTIWAWGLGLQGQLGNGSINTSGLPVVVFGFGVDSTPYTYTITNGTVIITGYTGAGGDVTIPNTINGVTVDSIGDSAFFLNESLTSVTIPASVTSIGFYAFEGCLSLGSVTIGTNVASIGINAFESCNSLTNVTIPASVTNIEVGAFSDCTSLTAIDVDPSNPAYSSLGGVLFDKSQATLIQYPAGLAGSYTIPDSVTNIADVAFSQCAYLTGVTIGTNVTSIGNEVFTLCTSLPSVTIPASVTSIGSSVFISCFSLTAINVDPSNPAYRSVGGVLFDKSQATLIEYPGGIAGGYTIPNGVTSIENGAFAICPITSVTIPAGVTNIGVTAFDYCRGLTSVTIPASVATIGGSAFRNCTNLTAIYFQGNAPLSDLSVFSAGGGYDPATIYYWAGTTGWTDPFDGLPTVLLSNVTQYTLLHTFTGAPGDGALPQGSLTLAGSTLYGMTPHGGSSNTGIVFVIDTDGTGFNILHNFPSGTGDGAIPFGSLTLAGPTLFGLTSHGGSNNNGSVFAINTDGTGYTILYNFGSSLVDGINPNGSLTLSGSALYGMTLAGGSNFFGSVFAINTDGTGYTILHNFAGGSGDGSVPMGSLTLDGSTLYGMTGNGGISNNGVMFAINTDGTGYAILHNFTGGSGDGATPSFSSLTLGGSTLYGTTPVGGTNNTGVVFAINTDGTGFTILHDFVGGSSDGSGPMGSLTLDGSTLYGMTGSGGISNNGVMFAINTNGTGYTILHKFAGGSGDGIWPLGSSLTLAGSTLFGMTSGGGSNNDGVVFALPLNPVSTTITTSNVLPAGVAGSAYNLSLTASGLPPFTWSVVSNSLPDGLSLDGGTGIISGIPTAAGVATFVIGCTAADAFYSEKSFTLTINDALCPTNGFFVENVTWGLSQSAAFDGTNFLVGIQHRLVIGTNSSSPIAAQLISQAGTKVGAPISIARTGGAPAVAFDGTNYLMVWPDDARADGMNDNNSVYGQFIDRSGVVVGSPFLISELPTGPLDEKPFGISFDGSQYLVVYGIGTNLHQGAIDQLAARFISPAGVVGSEIILATGDLRLPALAFNGTDYLVVWQQSNVGGGDPWDVTGMSITTNGTPAAPFGISQTPSLSYNPLTVASDGSNFLVVWPFDTGYGSPDPAAWELHGRLVAADGSFGSSEVTVASTASQPVFPFSAFDGVNYCVTWTDSSVTNDLNIAGQFVTKAGALLGDPLSFVTCPGNQFPSPVVFGGGRYLVLWGDGVDSSVGSGTAINGMFIPVAPVITNDSFLPVGYVGTGYSYSLTVSNGTGPFTWSVVSNSLPAGLSMCSTGLISGTPTSGGSTTFIIRSTGADGLYVDQTFTLYIATPYTFTTLAGLAGTPGTNDGTGSGARFDGPAGVAVDSAGNIFVADIANQTIRKVTPSGVVTTIAGSPGIYGASISNLFIYSPVGVAVDSADNVYMTYNLTIQKVTPAGVVTTIAGSADNPGTADGTNGAARFNILTSVAADSIGNLYVTDSGNQTIRKVSPVGTNWVVTTIAGSAGVSGSADGTNSTALFSSPTGVAVDSAGNLYVADSSNATIRAISPVGTNWVVTTIGGVAGVIGSADGVGRAAQFNYPIGVTADSAGNLYVCDNDVIRKASPLGTNWVVTTVGGAAGVIGSADGTGSSARFNFDVGLPSLSFGTVSHCSFIGFPHSAGVTVDSVGNLYVADAGNNTIRRGVPPFATLHSFLNGNDGAAPIAGLVRGSDCNFYGTTSTGGASSNGVIFQITPNGAITNLWESDAQGLSSLIQGTDGNFYGATAQGGLNGWGRIFMITPGGVFSNLYDFANTGDGGSPGGLVQGTDGNFYGVTQAGNGSVFQLTPAGIFTTLYDFAGGGSLAGPTSPGLIQGRDGAFYGLANYGGGYSLGGVFKIAADGAFTSLYEFTGSGDGGGTDGSTPYGGLTQGSDGNFYGTTYYGGSDNSGTVFMITPTGSITTLWSFSGASDGKYPIAGLMQSSDGNFYGTTSAGGSGGSGTMFMITPVGDLTTLYTFTDQNDGDYPQASIVQGCDGSLYTVVSAGGIGYNGTVFRLTLGTLAPTAMPIITPAGGLFTNSVDVTLSCPMPPGATITYTTDGTVPTTNSAVYTGAFTLTGNTLVQAAAFGVGYGPSAVAAANFTVPLVPFSVYRWSTYAGSPGTFGSAEANGNSSSAQFRAPYGVTVDSLNVVHLADQLNYTIRELNDGDGFYSSTIAGSVGSDGSADGAGSAAQFNDPSGMAQDGAGNLYVADASNFTIRQLTWDGYNWNSSTIAGTAGSSGNADGPGGSAQFGYPTGVAADSAGNVYVADYGNGTIRMLTQTATNWVVSTIAGLAENYGSADGTNSDARFESPIGITVDTNGIVYVVDQDNNTIRKIAPAGPNWVVTTIAGLAGVDGSADGTNSDARFVLPLGIAADQIGNLYVVDQGNETIRKLTPSGSDWIVTTIGGLAGNWGSNDGVNTDARFYYPAGITVDGSGNLFVTDLGNGTVRMGQPTLAYPVELPVITPASGIISNLVNVSITCNTSGSSILFTTDGSDPLTNPNGTAIWYEGSFQIVTSTTVKAVGVVNFYPPSPTATANFTVLNTPAAPPDISPLGGSFSNTVSVTLSCTTLGSTIQYTTDGSDPLTSYSASTYYSPIMLTTSATVIAVGQAAGYTPSVLATATFAWVSSPVATPSISPASGTYTNPVAVSLTCATPGRQIKYTIDGTDPTTSGTASYYYGAFYVFNSATVSAVGLAAGYTPSSVAAASFTVVNTPAAQPTISTLQGGDVFTNLVSVYVNCSTFGRVITFTTDGSIPTINSPQFDNTSYLQLTNSTTFQAVGFAPGYTPSPVAVTNFTVVSVPTAAAPVISPVGGFYINSVQVTVTSVTAGATIFYTTDGSSPSTNSAVYTGPIILTNPTTTVRAISTASGNIGSEVSSTVFDVAPFVPGEIYNWTTIAGRATWWGFDDGTNQNARFAYPNGIAVDNAGNIFVTDKYNSNIRKLTPDGTNWVVTTIAGQVWSPGSVDGTGSNARFGGPIGIAVDAAGNLFVADAEGEPGNYTIRKVTPVGSDWVVTTIAGLPFNWGAADGANSDARFSYPAGIAVDTNGNVYVADRNNYNVRKLSLVGTNWIVSTIAGQANNGGSADGTNGAAQFQGPTGIAVDRAGNLLVVDQYNSTIRQLTPAGTNWVVTTIAGLAYNSGSADGTNSDARFYYPTGVAVDTNGNVFVTDMSNNTIRKLTPVGTNWVVTTIGGRYSDSGSADATNTSARFSGPAFVAVNPAGNLFVSDLYNSTVRQGTPIMVLTANLTVTANPSGGGAVTGGGVYAIGTNVLIAATASNNWSFTAWSDGNTNASRTVVIPPTNITYTAQFIRQAVATPILAPAGGTFTNSVLVSLSCATTGATLTYTTDGSTPTTNSTVYSGPITLNTSATVQVLGVKSGLNPSAIAAGSFTVVVPAVPCAYSLSSSGASADSSSGSGSFSVIAGSGCSWSANSDSPSWLHASGSASGNGSVSYTYDANSDSSARTGHITVVDQTYTVIQLACSYALSATNVSLASNAGSGSFSVVTGSSCNWSALSDASSWLHTSSSGSGNGSVSYTYDANSGGSARTGHITVGSQVCTVTQPACSYSLSASSASLGSAATTGSFTVTANVGCSWSVSSSDGWLTITAGASGSGNGTVVYAVTANASNCLARTGTLTLAGQTFTVTQAAGSGATALPVTAASVGSDASNGSLTVAASAGCNWTANSNVGWLTVTAGSSGTGPSNVAYAVASNASNCTARVGTLSVAGELFTVTQAAGVGSFALSATSAQVGGRASTNSLTVVASADCTWTATSTNDWITILTGASGSGTGTVTYVLAVAATNRTGTLTIAGQTFTVAQVLGPDLTGAWLPAPGTNGWEAAISGTFTNPVTGIPSNLILGAFDIQNIGEVAAGASKAVFYLSPTPSFDSSTAILLTKATNSVPALATNAMHTALFGVLTPPGVTASNMYLVAVVDATGTVDESNESNNISIYPIQLGDLTTRAALRKYNQTRQLMRANLRKLKAAQLKAARLLAAQLKAAAAKGKK